MHVAGIILAIAAVIVLLLIIVLVKKYDVLNARKEYIKLSRGESLYAGKTVERKVEAKEKAAKVYEDAMSKVVVKDDVLNEKEMEILKRLESRKDTLKRNDKYAASDNAKTGKAQIGKTEKLSDAMPEESTVKKNIKGDASTVEKMNKTSKQIANTQKPGETELLSNNQIGKTELLPENKIRNTELLSGENVSAKSENNEPGKTELLNEKMSKTEILA